MSNFEKKAFFIFIDLHWRYFLPRISIFFRSCRINMYQVLFCVTGDLIRVCLFTNILAFPSSTIGDRISLVLVFRFLRFTLFLSLAFLRQTMFFFVVHYTLYFRWSDHILQQQRAACTKLSHGEERELQRSCSHLVVFHFLLSFGFHSVHTSIPGKLGFNCFTFTQIG